MDDKLLTLPWQIQVALASGYSAYLVSYIGIRDYHKDLDSIFRALSFGLIAVGILYLMPSEHPVLSVIVAYTVTVCFGLWWRKFGRGWLAWTLRKLKIAWSDDTPSAMSRLQDNAEVEASQISVLLEDGSWLFCTNCYEFKDEPYGPFVLGQSGDVLMYVNKSETSDGSTNEPEGVITPGWGSLVTYVPASKLKQISIRYRPKASAPSAAVEKTAEVQQERSAEPTSLGSMFQDEVSAQTPAGEQPKD